MAWRHLCSIFC